MTTKDPWLATAFVPSDSSIALWKPTTNCFKRKDGDVKLLELPKSTMILQERNAVLGQLHLRYR